MKPSNELTRLGSPRRRNWQRVSIAVVAVLALSSVFVAGIRPANAQATFSDWAQIGDDIDGEAADDRSGEAVAISDDGNTIIIGARNNDGCSELEGHARVFRFDGAGWDQLGNDIDGEENIDLLGAAVPISHDGNIVLTADGTPIDVGDIRVFQFDGNDWEQIGSNIRGELGQIGAAMSGDGLTVVIGATQAGSPLYAGRVSVHRLVGTDWTQIGDSINGEMPFDPIGGQVDISADGNTFVLGDFSGGLARIYRFDGTNWNHLGGDLAGGATAMSADGLTVALGRRPNDKDSEQTQVFRFDGTDWNQLGNDINGEAADDGSGASVGISAMRSLVLLVMTSSSAAPATID